MTTQLAFEITQAEREVADLLPVNAPVADCRRVLDATPIWFHTFALNQEAGLYTPGLARDHRYRIPFLPADLTGQSVLDVGTCDGFYAFLAEARGATRVLAVDNEQYCRMVKGRWNLDITGGSTFRTMSALLGSRVDYLKADALDLAGFPERFDFIYCCGMLHRVENPLGMLQILRGLLNPGGRILLETYGAPTDTPVMQVLAAGEANSGDDVHYWGFSARALARLAEWSGLAETGDTLETTIDGHPRIIGTLTAV